MSLYYNGCRAFVFFDLLVDGISDNVATKAVSFGLAMTPDGSRMFMEVYETVAAVQVPAESALPVPHLAMGLIVTEAVIAAAEPFWQRKVMMPLIVPFCVSVVVITMK